MIEIDKKYGFPNFTSDVNCIRLCDSNKLIISDIWSFWDYVIKKNGINKSFMSSLLEQAKFFYEAAENSPIKSRPLLYYYSFLNFSKIVINLKMNYGSCSYLHGVSQNGTDKFSNAQISVMSFLPEPQHTKKNVSAEFERVLNNNTISSKTTINVKSLLNHCVGIHRTYSEIYNQKEIFCKLENESLYKYGRELVFKANVKCDDETYSNLNNRGYGLERESDKVIYKKIYEMPSSRYVTRQSYYELSQLIRNDGLWYFIGKDGYVNYLSTCPTDRYSPEFIIYNAMFYFGSITRYYPYLFDEIFSAKEQWLMGEFLTTQPKQFIYLTTAKILSQDVLKAYADF